MSSLLNHNRVARALWRTGICLFTPIGNRPSQTLTRQASAPADAKEHPPGRRRPSRRLKSASPGAYAPSVGLRRRKRRTFGRRRPTVGRRPLEAEFIRHTPRQASASADARDALSVGAGRPLAEGPWRPNSFGIQSRRFAKGLRTKRSVFQKPLVPDIGPGPHPFSVRIRLGLLGDRFQFRDQATRLMMFLLPLDIGHNSLHIPTADAEGAVEALPLEGQPGLNTSLTKWEETPFSRLTSSATVTVLGI